MTTRATSAKDFAERVDQVVAKHRDLLANSDESLLRDLRKQLRQQAAAGTASAWLPCAESAGKIARRWAWRLLLLYLLLAGLRAAFNWQFQSALENWEKSDAATNLDLSIHFLLRKLAVPLGLPHIRRMQRASAGQCLVSNPLHSERPVCCRCKFNITASKIANLEKTRDSFDKILAGGKTRVFLVVNANQKDVEFQRLGAIYRDNRADVENGFNDVASLAGPSVSRLETLFGDVQEPPVASAVQWTFGHVEAVRHLREVLQRPQMVPPYVEVNLHRSLLFLGRELPTSTEVQLDQHSLSGQIFAVGLHGETVVRVSSKPACCKADKRVTRTVVLRVGRLLSLPSDCFAVTASRNGTHYSTVYFGSVPTALDGGK